MDADYADNLLLLANFPAAIPSHDLNYTNTVLLQGYKEVYFIT